MTPCVIILPLRSTLHKSTCLFYTGCHGRAKRIEKIQCFFLANLFYWNIYALKKKTTINKKIAYAFEKNMSFHIKKIEKKTIEKKKKKKE